MEVERISTDKNNLSETLAETYYFHEFKFKGIFKHARSGQQMQVVCSIFDINCGYIARVEGKKREDLVITAHTTDTTPNNAINRSAWILRQLDKLIGLKLED